MCTLSHNSLITQFLYVKNFDLTISPDLSCGDGTHPEIQICRRSFFLCFPLRFLVAALHFFAEFHFFVIIFFNSYFCDFTLILCLFCDFTLVCLFL